MCQSLNEVLQKTGTPTAGWQNMMPTIIVFLPPATLLHPMHSLRRPFIGSLSHIAGAIMIPGAIGPHDRPPEENQSQLFFDLLELATCYWLLGFS